jgi:hypothetical protein
MDKPYPKAQEAIREVANRWADECRSEVKSNDDLCTQDTPTLQNDGQVNMEMPSFQVVITAIPSHTGRLLYSIELREGSNGT